jgi:hypothetical protein
MPEKLRVQVLLTEAERERFRKCATAAGRSLSAWLREAGIQRADRHEKRDRLDTVEKLEAFFAECRRTAENRDREPGWDEAEAMIREESTRGLPKP